MKPGSQNARLLQVLSDGQWHLSRELHERAGYMRTNSRVAELRSYGHTILGEHVPHKTGTDGYRYRLVQPSAPGSASTESDDFRSTGPVTAVPRAPINTEPTQLALEVAS